MFVLVSARRVKSSPVRPWSHQLRNVAPHAFSAPSARGSGHAPRRRAARQRGAPARRAPFDGSALAGLGGLNGWISPWAVLGAATVALFHGAHEASPAFRRSPDAEAPGGDGIEDWRGVALGTTAAICLVWAQMVPATFIYFQF